MAFAFTLVLVGLSWNSRSAFALDVVYRKSTSSPAQGELSEATKTQVTLKRKIGEPEVIPVNDIIDIRFDGEPTKLNLARNAAQAGRYDVALETYNAVLTDIPANAEVLRTDVAFLIARANAKIAQGDPSKIDAAIKGLESFRSAHAGSFRDFEALHLLGDLYLQKEDFANAQAMFTLFGQAPWPEYQVAAQSANADILLRQGNIDGALSAYEAAISAPAKSPAEQAQRYNAMLGKANCLIRKQQLEPALTVTQTVIDEAPVTDPAVLATAYLRQGDCLQQLGRTYEALIAYLHVDVLFSHEKALHAESLYHLTQLWGAVGKPDRAADSRAMLESDYPNSPWAKKLTAGTSG